MVVSLSKILLFLIEFYFLVVVNFVRRKQWQGQWKERWFFEHVSVSVDAPLGVHATLVLDISACLSHAGALGLHHIPV